MHTVTLLVALVASTQTGVTSSTMRQLQHQVRLIYQDASVDIEWTEPTTPGALMVNVLRVLPPLPGCESALGCAVVDRLGVTRPVAMIANDAIRLEELRHPLLRGRLTSYVIAHEIGHLVGLEHSGERGIMHRNSEWLPYVKWSRAEVSALNGILASGQSLAMRAVSPPGR